MPDNITQQIMDVLQRNLHSAWNNDLETYQATTADDVSFYEWTVSPQRIDGIDFHLRELRAAQASAQADPSYHFEIEILQPRVQVYGDIAIVTYTLLTREVTAGGVIRKSNNETRVFHNFGGGATPGWKLVHCHKSPIATQSTLALLHT